MNSTVLEDCIKKVSRRIPEEDIPLLASCAQSRQLKKGQALLKEGDICREFYLVESGYLRTYYNKDGVAINMNFTFEGDFTTNPQSMNGRHPSELIIEAGEHAKVWVFNLDNIIHSSFFKTHTPTERYLFIEEHNPRLLQRISLSQVASYLGVTRETLSRIRAKRN